MIECITEEIEILRKAINVYGADCQIDKAIEEMSELTKALLKFRYIEKDYEEQIVGDAVAEEMADVEIMVEQLRMIFRNNAKVQHYRKEKLERLERRLRDE